MKTVLITGHTSGCGESLAVKFLSLGFKVVGLSRSSTQYSELMNNPHFYELPSYDLSKMNDDVEMSYMIHDISAHEYDIVINNAGMTNRAYIEDHTYPDIIRLMNVNAVAPMMIHKATDIEGKDQVFVNILSGSAVKEFRMLPIYASAKAALYKFSLQIVKDWEDQGISNKKILNILPGAIDTKLCPTHYKDGRVRLITPDELAGKVIESMEEFINSNKVIYDLNIENDRL